MNPAQSHAAQPPCRENPVLAAPPRCSAEACLQAAVRASGCLLAATDLASGIQAAVQALQTHTGLDRVYVFADAPGEQGVVLVGEALARGVSSIRSLLGDRIYTDAEFDRVIPTLRAGRIHQSVPQQRTGESAQLNAAVVTRSDLILPVFLRGHFWGFVGFDDCQNDRAWGGAEVLALQGAAAALAAAVQRDAVAVAREAERQRLEALLRAVAEASQYMVSHDDLPTALTLALGALRLHTGVDRVFLIRYASEERASYFWLESRRDGLSPFEAGFGPGPWPDDDFAHVAYPLREGCVYRSTVAARQAADAAANKINGSLSDLIVPIMVDGQYRACLGFDDNSSPRDWTDAEVAVLQTAASAISAALSQDAARTSEARDAEALSLRDRLLAVVAQSLQFLLGDADDDFASSVQATLGALGQACGIHRVKVWLQRTDATSGELVHVLEHEWWAPGLASQTSLGLTQFPNAWMPDWLATLQAGQAWWTLGDDVPRQVRARFARSGVRSAGAVPIFGGGKYLGQVAFGDCVNRRLWSAAEVDALNAAARTVGAAIYRHALQHAILAERDLRISAEQARADHAQQVAARIERHSRLLAAVAASAEDLLACADPADCLDTVLARVGEATHAERVCLARLDWTPQDPALHGWQEIAHEWARAGVVRQTDGPLRRFAMQRSDATWDLVLTQFASERRILSTIENLDEPFRSEQLALGIVWTLCYPVLLEGRVWGLLGMDYATPFDDYDEADLAALQTVATTIADAMLRRTLEQRALATERARVDEAQALNHLLESVVQSSRELLHAPDFSGGLQKWLQVLAKAVDADVALLGSLTPNADEGVLADWQANWGKSGIRDTPPVPATADFIDWHSRLLRGEAIWAQREDLLDPASVRYWQDIDCWTKLLMPVVSAGGTLGFLCFDWRERRAWQPAYGTVLRTAADSVAAAIQRHEATKTLLTEREVRIGEEQRRSADLARANEALRVSLAALAETPSEAGFVSRCLLQLSQQADASAAYLFGYDEPGSTLRLMGAAAEGTFHAAGLADDPPMFRSGFQCDPLLRAQLVTSGRLWWRLLQSSAERRGYAAEIQRWQTQQGYRADALHALMVGRQMVGLVALEFTNAQPPSNTRQALTHTLCQTLTLAIELARLGALARISGERAAVLGERQRMAGEIHDSLAQSFTSIAMQSESLAGRLAGEPESVRVLRMIERTAREGLAEARSSVLALLPTAGAAGSLDEALAELATRSSLPGGIQCRFDCQGTPVMLSSAPREALLRIAQEATSNAMRHSGGSQIALRLVYTGAAVALTVEDDGKGPQRAASPKHNGGFGMAGMRARAEAVGAQLHLAVAALGGCSVQVVLPYEKAGPAP
jgi:signal transduction histidine kinase